MRGRERGDGEMVAWRCTSAPVHFLLEGDSVLPCAVAVLVLRGEDVEFIWLRACIRCLGVAPAVPAVMGSFGSGKRSAQLTSVLSLMGRLERVRFEDSVREVLGVPELQDGRNFYW